MVLALAVGGCPSSLSAPGDAGVDGTGADTDIAPDALPCTPSPELCNGRDDDCDGLVDELIEMAVGQRGEQGDEARVARLGDATAVAWISLLHEDAPHLVLSIVPDDGSPASRVDLGLAVPARASIAWTGDEVALAWAELTPTRYGLITFATVSVEGEVVVPPVTVSDPVMDAGAPSLAWIDGEFALAWSQMPDDPRIDHVFYARLSSEGDRVHGPVPLADSSVSTEQPLLAWTGEQLGLGWDRPLSTRSGAFFAPISLDGDLLADPTYASNLSEAVGFAGLVWTGGAFVMAWRDSEARFTLARLSPTGERLGDAIHPDGVTGHLQTPSIAWSGAELVAAWTELPYPSGLYTYWTTMSEDGELLASPAPVEDLSTDSARPSVAADDTRYAIAWTSQGSPVTTVRLRVTCRP